MELRTTCRRVRLTDGVRPVMSAADLLSVADVVKRHGLKDRRAARRLVDEVGALVFAMNLYVRRAELVAYEERQIAARSSERVAPSPVGRGREVRSRPTPKRPLEPGWWREDS